VHSARPDVAPYGLSKVIPGIQPASLVDNMNLSEAVPLIRACVDQMNSRYGKTVFDEWAVILRNEKSDYVLNYSGPRKEDFRRNFWTDVDVLGEDFASEKFSAGDFSFARHGVGTSFEAFLMLGAGIYLICNNTQSSMDEIARDSRWLSAQLPFVELSEKARAHPIAYKAY
jgi:hypothetical protein